MENERTSREIEKGIVKESMPNHLFKIQLERGASVTAHLSEKLRLTSVRLVPGDEVEVELSDFNNERARVIRRGKK